MRARVNKPPRAGKENSAQNKPIPQPKSSLNTRNRTSLDKGSNADRSDRSVNFGSKDFKAVLDPRIAQQVLDYDSNMMSLSSETSKNTVQLRGLSLAIKNSVKRPFGYQPQQEEVLQARELGKAPVQDVLPTTLIEVLRSLAPFRKISSKSVKGREISTPHLDEKSQDQFSIQAHELQKDVSQSPETKNSTRATILASKSLGLKQKRSRQKSKGRKETLVEFLDTNLPNDLFMEMKGKIEPVQQKRQAKTQLNIGNFHRPNTSTKLQDFQKKGMMTTNQQESAYRKSRMAMQKNSRLVGAAKTQTSLKRHNISKPTMSVSHERSRTKSASRHDIPRSPEKSGSPARTTAENIMKMNHPEVIEGPRFGRRSTLDQKNLLEASSESRDLPRKARNVKSATRFEPTINLTTHNFKQNESDQSIQTFNNLKDPHNLSHLNFKQHGSSLYTAGGFDQNLPQTRSTQQPQLSQPSEFKVLHAHMKALRQENSDSPIQHQNSKSGKIDKLIKQTFKKRRQSDFQQLLAQKKTQVETKKRKLELEQVNNRVRQKNKEMVVRRQKQNSSILHNKSLNGIHLLDCFDQQTINALENEHSTLDISKLLSSAQDYFLKAKSKERKRISKDRLEMSDKSSSPEPFLQSQTQKLLKTKKSQSKSIESTEQRELSVLESLEPRLRQHRRSNGLEFIDVRREILKEFGQQSKHLRPKKDSSRQQTDTDPSLMNTQANLKISQSQRQVLKSLSTQMTFLRNSTDLHRRDNSEENPSATQPLQQPVLLRKTSPDEHIKKTLDIFAHKKDKIRKFIIQKQKQNSKARHKQQSAAIKKTLKIRENLQQLNREAKMMLVTKGKDKTIGQLQLHGKLTHVNVPGIVGNRTQKVRKTRKTQVNQTLLDQQEQSEQERGHNRRHLEGGMNTISPAKTYFEVSDNSINMSANMPRRLNAAGSRDRSYENVIRERASSAGTQGRRKNIHKSNLAPCFEISNSAKTLKAKLKNSRSTSLQESASRGAPSQNASIINNQTHVPVMSATILVRQAKKKLSGKTQKFGSNRLRQKLEAKEIAHAFVPVKGMYNFKSKFKAHEGLRRGHKTMLEDSSMHTLTSSLRNLNGERSTQAANKIFQDSQDQSHLESSLQIDKQDAAKVIQKEVRKYLNHLGFYEAFSNDGSSVKSNKQFNLFIDKNQLRQELDRTPDRNSSLSRSRSRSSGKSGKKRKSNRSSKRSNMAVLVASNEKDWLPQSLQPSEQKVNQDSADKSLDAFSPVQMPASNQQIDSHVTFQNERDRLNIFDHEAQNSIEENKMTFAPVEKPLKSLKNLRSTDSDELQQKLLANQIKQSYHDKKAMQHLFHRPGQQLKSQDDGRTPERDSGSEIDVHQVQLSVESKLSSHPDQRSQSSSIFDHKAFQQFTDKQLSSIKESNDYRKLVQFREECLQLRERKEKNLISKQLKANEVSPRTYKAKRDQIEHWVRVERNEIEKTKHTFEEEWEKTVKMIEDTQKDVDKIKERIPSGQNFSQNGKSHGFHSQSAQSLSVSSRAHNEFCFNQLPALDSHLKSILIDEDPRSYRSGQLDTRVPILHISNLHPDEGFRLSSRRSHDRANLECLTDDPNLQGLNQVHSSSENLDQIDHEPSAEFLERLEKGTKKELVNSELEESCNFPKSASNSIALTGLNSLTMPEEVTNTELNLAQFKLEPEIFKSENFEGKSEDLKEDSLLQNEPVFAKEPEIVSSGSPEKPDAASEASETPELITAVTRKKPKRSLALETLVRDIRKDQMVKFAVIDSLTDELLLALLQDEIEAPEPRDPSKKLELKQKQEEAKEKSKEEVFTIDSGEKAERKEWIEFRQRHLIEKDLIRCDAYVNEIVDALLVFDLDGLSDIEDDAAVMPSDNFHVQFLKMLTQPIAKNPGDVLKLLQAQEIGSYQHFETTMEIQKYPIIPVDLYLRIEKQREEALLARRGLPEPKVQVAWESIHIFNKAMFDAVNESLMKFRPYGITGEPMPWSQKVRRLQTKVDIQSVDTERLFQMIKQEVFRWIQMFAGCIPSPVFAFPSKKNRGKEDFCQELMHETREKRLTTLLSSETIEQEHHWLNYEHEEAQVKIDLSDMILESLVEELIGLLQQKQKF